MKRWFPLPVTSVLLFLIWLLVNQSVSPGQLFLAVVLAISLPLMFRSLQPMNDPVIYRPLTLFTLLAKALVEVVRSCFNVSAIIMFRKNDGIQSRFIRVPLDMTNNYGLALLSCLINITPGTVWVELMEDSGELSLHVFDLHDEQWWIDTIKTKYELPLRMIFENYSPGHDSGNDKEVV
jgi:multicomponent K+:H+ antiporter subunit E